MIRNDQVAFLISGTGMIQVERADAWCFDGRGHAQTRRSVVKTQGGGCNFDSHRRNYRDDLVLSGRYGTIASYSLSIRQVTVRPCQFEG